MARLYKGGRVDLDALRDPENPDPCVEAKEQPTKSKAGKDVLFLRLSPELKAQIIAYSKETKTTANNAAILLFEKAFESIEGETHKKPKKAKEPSNEEILDTTKD